jgi:hypothetical protein
VICQDQGIAYHEAGHAVMGWLLGGVLVGGRSFVLAVIFRNLLFAFVKALYYRRAPWYQRGLIHKALPKVSVILSNDVEDRFLGKPSMVLGKWPVHGGKLFIGHGSRLGRDVIRIVRKKGLRLRLIARQSVQGGLLLPLGVRDHQHSRGASQAQPRWQYPQAGLLSEDHEA